MAKTEIIGYEQRLICGALRRCPIIREVSEEYVPQYCIYGRMGLDSDYYCLRSNIPEPDVQYWWNYYKATWRHVEIRSQV
ncbi:hypothetical protein MVUOKPPV_CDS0236 [Klebsiella phage phi1_175008]|uniref:Uncharacterized protein n=1 Tax=Klebsiella phage phi1_175008 TaxID=3127744 RepID=A0ACD5FRS2_9CAUD